jgi:hypothetical protein
MIINVKQGVWLAQLNDHFLQFIEALHEVWTRWGDTPTITAGADGKHMEGSKHYKNDAWDVRVWGLHNPQKQADQLRERLKEIDAQWIVLYGDEDHLDHIHVGYGG